MLALEKVNTYYGNSHVLHDVSLKVEQGEVVALVGRNGVGKTTSMRTVMGLTPARRGRGVTPPPTHDSIAPILALGVFQVTLSTPGVFLPLFSDTRFTANALPLNE